MTNWSLYMIQESTLKALFSENYNSVKALQSIEEPDLKDFRDINSVTRVQITMLRRFIRCLNCKQHPPVYRWAEGSGVLLGAGSGPLSSSATSTAPFTAGLNAFQSNSDEAQSHGSEFTYGAGPSTGNSQYLQN